MNGQTVWLASYPKSGNTWFRAVYFAWRWRRAPALDELGTIASARERFDDALGISSSDLTADEIEELRPRADEIVDRDFGGLHVEKIHDRLALDSGGQIVSTEATRAAIYIVRDPRDVAVSVAHQNRISPDQAAAYLCDTATAISAGVNDLSDQLRQRLGTWSEHVLSWVDSPAIKVHAVRYEDCLTRPVDSFTRAFSEAGFTITSNDVADAIERASFANLQAIEASEGFRENRSRGERFFRQGRAGVWQEELSATAAARVWRTHSEVMSRFGYEE